LSNRIEHLLLIILSEELVNFRKLLYDRLLEDTKRNADSLQIFGTCGHVNIDGLQSGIVDDVVLY